MASHGLYRGASEVQGQGDAGHNNESPICVSEGSRGVHGEGA